MEFVRCVYFFRSGQVYSFVVLPALTARAFGDVFLFIFERRNFDCDLLSHLSWQLQFMLTSVLLVECCAASAHDPGADMRGISLSFPIAAVAVAAVPAGVARNDPVLPPLSRVVFLGQTGLWSSRLSRRRSATSSRTAIPTSGISFLSCRRYSGTILRKRIRCVGCVIVSRPTSPPARRMLLVLKSHTYFVQKVPPLVTAAH